MDKKLIAFYKRQLKSAGWYSIGGGWVGSPHMRRPYCQGWMDRNGPIYRIARSIEAFGAGLRKTKGE